MQINELCNNRRIFFQPKQQTGAIIDEEVCKILADCEETAVSLLKENEEVLVKISEYLLEKENITGTEFMELIKKYRPAE